MTAPAWLSEAMVAVTCERGADGGVRKGIELEIADVVGQDGGFLDGAILLLHGLAIAFGERPSEDGSGEAPAARRRGCRRSIEVRVVSDGAASGR
jgi:hypothetical protein